MIVPGKPRTRTLVVVETDHSRHVFELDAEATETWEHPAYNPPNTFGHHRLEVTGRILRHVVYDRADGDDLLKETNLLEEGRKSLKP